MHVTRLEIFGFKSFLEKLTLPVEAGITGIVGPNGCGKSNIVDALRWVLGETKASSLRGGVLEDVIFNGTDKLRPLGLAEVSITLRASDKDVFSDLLCSLAAANEQLREIAPAALPAAVASTGFSAERGADETRPSDGEAERESEQGSSPARPRPQLVVISGAQAEEAGRKTAVEEGRTAAQNSTEESDRPQPAADDEDAGAVLTRFAWLRSVEEVQITRRLYRSGESEFFINRVPCRLRDIKDLFRVVGLGARAYTIVAQGEVSRIVTARPEERRLIIEEAAGVSGFRDRIATSTRRLEETSVNVSRLDDVIKEVSRQANSLRVQASRARNREQLKERIVQLEKTLFKDAFSRFRRSWQEKEAVLRQAEAEEASLHAQFQKLHAQEHEARGVLMSIDVEGDALRARIDGIQEDLRVRAQKRSEYSNKVHGLRALHSSSQNEIKALEEHKTILKGRREQNTAEVRELESCNAELLRMLGGMEGRVEEELSSLSGKLDQLSGELTLKGQMIRRVRDELVSAASRRQALEEQIAAASPLSQLRRALGLEQGAEGGGPADASAEDLSALVRKLAGACRLFADELTVPAEYARAVQAVLAEKAGFLISKDFESVARRYSAVAQQCAEESCPLGIFRAAAKEEEPSPPSGANEKIPFPRLLDKIKVSADGRFAANRIFDRVYVCRGLEQALQFCSEPLAGGESFTLVSLDGDVVTDHSFQSLQRRGGIIQLKEEAAELEQVCEDMRKENEELLAQEDSLRAAMSAAERRRQDLLGESQRQQAKMRELANEQGIVDGKLQTARRLSAQLESDIEKTNQQISANLERTAKLAEEERLLNAELQGLQADDERSALQELQKLRGEYGALEAQRKAGRDRLSEASNSTEEARQQHERSRQDVSQGSLEFQKLEMEIQNLRDKISGEYGEAVLLEIERDVAESEGAVLELGDEEKSAQREEVGRLRSRVLREGEVDSTSIARYEEEKARLENLTAQRSDLEAAAVTLRKTIERLTITSEKRFLATFAAVKENFARCVARLFGGGKGGLELMDPSHPLDSGVEIVVRPPGKKLKTIDLMSGGEKALCAISMIFALFMHRPSPLCVLDEVDAPLDDTNLVRFLSMVKDMSGKTQFLMITHNKQSMAMARNLVGVTMQQPGASKVITVSLQEAYAHVA